MHRLLVFLFFFSSLISFGQNSLLGTAFSWFGKTDRNAMDTYLTGYSYRLIRETDSIKFHIVNYSLVKTENGTQPVINMLLSDTALEYISLDTYGHKTDLSVLKSGRFKSIGNAINGDFITTTYDNGTFLIHEDYEARANPLGKGEIAYFRYRIFRKYSAFDKMNGEKISYSADGSKISETYRNGVLDGQRTIYFPDGTIKRTENYRAGRLNGVASDYNQQGKLIHSSTHSYHWKYGMEKWYNAEGKLIKSLQWQRDIPVGTEKQTFNGTTIGSIPYVKGVKHGPAKIPVYEEEIIDSSNAEPIGIETVNFENDLKTGKAVCFRFGSKDTLYTAYYKAGKLDSTYRWYQQPMHSYYKNVPRYTKTFKDGLEEGIRTYVITAGPLKDSIYQVEPYKNGKLDGTVIQYYKKREDQSPEFIPGDWYPNYAFETYQMGVKNGPFLFRRDSMNYEKGNYVNGQLDGSNETQMVVAGKLIKTSGSYQNGVKTGEWTTDNITDELVIREQFDLGQKHGTFTKIINGFKTEEGFYDRDTLTRLMCFDNHGDFENYRLDTTKNTNLISFSVKTKKGDHLSELTYAVEEDHYSGDTLLLTLIRYVKKQPEEMSKKLDGPFHFSTPAYETNGYYKNGKLNGEIRVKHTRTGVLESIFYQDGEIRDREYTTFDTLTFYSGTFVSATSGEQISVKEGLRHGWCIEYDASGKEIRRRKYKGGILKKVVESKNAG